MAELNALPHFLSESLKGWMMPLSPVWAFNSSSYVGRWESALSWAAIPTERWGCGRAVMIQISGSKFLGTILGCTPYYPGDLHLLSVADRTLACTDDYIVILPLGPLGPCRIQLPSLVLLLPTSAPKQTPATPQPRALCQFHGLCEAPHSTQDCRCLEKRASYLCTHLSILYGIQFQMLHGLGTITKWPPSDALIYKTKMKFLCHLGGLQERWS